MPFLETSAKASLNVEEAFMRMTKEIKDKMQQKTGVKSSTTVAPIGQGRALPRQEPSTDDDPVNLKNGKKQGPK
jgi:hypothetical protein